VERTSAIQWSKLFIVEIRRGRMLVGLTGTCLRHRQIDEETLSTTLHPLYEYQ